MARKRTKPVVKYFTVGQTMFTVQQDGMPAYSKTNTLEGILKHLDWANKESMLDKFNEKREQIKVKLVKWPHGGYKFQLPDESEMVAPNKEVAQHTILCNLLAKISTVSESGKPSKQLIKYYSVQEFLDKLDEI